MHTEQMRDFIETKRLVLFPYTAENLALFNRDLPAFEERFGVVYRGEELDHLLTGFLLKLENEIAADEAHYLFFTEFLIVLKENDHVIGSIDYKYVPKDGVTEVGYGMNPAYEGQGYMTEALAAFLEFGRSLGIRTVLADTLKDNEKSQNVLKRCGFVCLREDKNLWWEKKLDPEEALYDRAVSYVEELFRRNAGGHDAAHTLRVTKNAMKIADEEAECDRETVMLAALLHDADDHKLFQTENNANARAFLKANGIPEDKTERIIEAINAVSFSRNGEKAPETPEGRIVQAADRLDAIGAVGIARTFAYGGEHGRPLEASVQHFYDKLLRLRDLMNTESGKKLAEKRHAFLEAFLQELHDELAQAQTDARERR